MYEKHLSRSDPQGVIDALADRCESTAQFERLLAFVVARDRFEYRRSTWFNRRHELRELGLELDEAA